MHSTLSTVVLLLLLILYWLSIRLPAFLAILAWAWIQATGRVASSTWRAMRCDVRFTLGDSAR